MNLIFPKVWSVFTVLKIYFCFSDFIRTNHCKSLRDISGECILPILHLEFMIHMPMNRIISWNNSVRCIWYTILMHLWHARLGCSNENQISNILVVSGMTRVISLSFVSITISCSRYMPVCMNTLSVYKEGRCESCSSFSQDILQSLMCDNQRIQWNWRISFGSWYITPFDTWLLQTHDERILYSS